MVRWVSKHCDPVMATGWHMVLGSLPLAALSLALEGDELLPRLAQIDGARRARTGYGCFVVCCTVSLTALVMDGQRVR